MRRQPSQADVLLDLLDRTGALDWVAIGAHVPWRDEMDESGQDTVFHAEGDVWTHTMMVVEALRKHELFDTLPDFDRRALLLATLFHDVAKPATRTAEFSDELQRERVSNPGHALRGAKFAWGHLWRTGLDTPMRERVFALIAWHQKIFHILNRDDPRQEVIRFSQLALMRDLVIHAQADNRGRISPGCAQAEVEIECVRLFAEELGCLDRPWPFVNDEARVIVGRENGKSPFYEPPEPKGSRLNLLSGLPGSGKDTYARQVLGDMPQVSLDAMRDEEDNEGTALQNAFEQARVYLRRKQDFCWNATNLTKNVRDKIIALARSYDGHVSIHALDTPYLTVLKQNRERASAIPEAAIERYADRWEPPTPLEAHRVVWIAPDRGARLAFSFPNVDESPACQPMPGSAV